MDHAKKLKAQIYSRIIFGLFAVSITAIILWHVALEQSVIDSFVAILIAFAMIIALCLIVAELLAKAVSEPVRVLTQAILHVAPGHDQTASSAPNLNDIKVGQELISSMALQVYQLASNEPAIQAENNSRRDSIIQAVNVVNHLPLPLYVLNSNREITNASEAGIAYVGLESGKLFGTIIEESIRMEFPSEHTLNAWIDECQSKKVTSTFFWERVHVKLADESIKQCDISAHYNRDNPSGAEFIITLFDRTDRYNQDDESLGFVAMAVHELRTPLTMLRGYIEVLEDELLESVDDEMKDFMHKMNVAAGQLTVFVNNILNVARIEQNQLMMNLTENNWAKTLHKILDDLEIRAKINNMEIERHIDDSIPTVGIDSISIYEVVANLIDNAIKYSRGSEKIIVSSQISKDGLVETTVQDFGVGMPSSVTANLFEKFYRNHRTRGKASGTGLGLFLTKSIISAHGGQVWVNSKEGKGSTFGFSVVPYSQLSSEQKQGETSGIVRQSHGWVKNHSMYRR